MAGQAYDKNAGAHTDRVNENTQARSEGNVLEEVNKTPPKERLDIISGAEGKGKDVPQGFKSADGSDAQVVQQKQERVEKKYEDKVVQVGAVQVRDMAPGVDSMAAVKVNVRETTETKSTEVKETPVQASGRGSGDAAAGGRGGRDGAGDDERDGRQGDRHDGSKNAEGGVGKDGAEAAEGKEKEGEREGQEGERGAASEAADAASKTADEVADQVAKMMEGVGGAGAEAADAARDAAQKAADASGSGGDAQDRHRNPHRRR